MLADPSTAPSEISLWKGHTSQWVHFWYYLFCVLLVIAALVGMPFTAGLSAIGLVVPFGMWLVRWWMTKTTSYELTTQRFIHSRGILVRTVDRIDVIDIDDVSYEQGIIQRTLGVGKIQLESKDRSHPSLVLAGIDQVERVSGMIDDVRRKERRKRSLHIDAS